MPALTWLEVISTIAFHLLACIYFGVFIIILSTFPDEEYAAAGRHIDTVTSGSTMRRTLWLLTATKSAYGGGLILCGIAGAFYVTRVFLSSSEDAQKTTRKCCINLVAVVCFVIFASVSIYGFYCYDSIKLLKSEGGRLFESEQCRYVCCGLTRPSVGQDLVPTAFRNKNRFSLTLPSCCYAVTMATEGHVYRCRPITVFGSVRHEDKCRAHEVEFSHNTTCSPFMVETVEQLQYTSMMLGMASACATLLLSVLLCSRACSKQKDTPQQTRLNTVSRTNEGIYWPSRAIFKNHRNETFKAYDSVGNDLIHPTGGPPHVSNETH